MSLNKDLVVCFLLLYAFTINIKCQNFKEISKTLDETLVKSFRRPLYSEATSLFLQEYEFDTKTGNREEIIIRNISLHKYAKIADNINWLLLQMEEPYLIRAEKSTLYFYNTSLDNFLIEPNINITIEGNILLFNVFDLNTITKKNENCVKDLIAVLCVETQTDHFLYWYRIFENTYKLYLKMSVQKQIEAIEFVHEGDQHELLLLSDDNSYIKGQSSIDVYRFNVDCFNHRIDIRFCRQLNVSKIFDIQICTIYGNTMLAFKGIDRIVLYKRENEDTLCDYQEFQIIQSNKIINFVCFESGYIEYLAVAGKESHLFYFENEFQEVETDLQFNETTEIIWVTAIPLNTYRDESLLLIQLENATIIPLAWQGLKFKRVSLPNQIMNNIDLSKIIGIPKIGFMYGNTLVRIEVMLQELIHPVYDDIESILKSQTLLEEVFQKQEVIFDETETRLNKSYFKNVEFCNFSKVNTIDVTIKKDIYYDTIKVDSIDLKSEDVSINMMSSLKKLEKFETKLNQILSKLKSIDNSTKIILSSNIRINGDFLVNDILRAKNVNAAFINNALTSSGINYIVNYTADIIVNDAKSFLTIDADNLTVFTLNSIPLKEIVFNDSINNYNDVNFEKLKRLKINGYLNFTKINDFNWENLFQNIIWKDKLEFITGNTTIETQLTAEECSVENLNNLRYPQDYILINDNSSIEIIGDKYFSNLTVSNLLGMKSINEIDIDDFIILNRLEVIDEEIIFDDLEVDGILQIDGNITGFDINNNENTLNETNKLSSDIIFENLIVSGNIVLEDSINVKKWSDFDDLLLKTEKNVIIMGNKKFLNSINLKSNVTIESKQINNHTLSEFVTLDTNQQFPYLKKILANVKFGDVILGAMKKLEDRIIYEQNSSDCLNKILFFTKSPIIDDLSFDTLKQTISRVIFFNKLNQIFQKVHFENLTLATLTAGEVLPNVINRIWNYTDLVKHVLTISTQQNLTGSLIIDNLETVILDTTVINGIPINKLNELLKQTKSLYNNVLNGDVFIKSLRVTKKITTASINRQNILDICNEGNATTVIFTKNVSIENLTVIGHTNAIYLSELVADIVKKIDRNATFTGYKTLKNIKCEFLETRFINGHSVDDILHASKEQTLKGPVVINGSVTALKNFNITGKIGNLFLQDFTDKFKFVGNNSYILRGDVNFIQNASVTKMDVNGPIQELLFYNFLQTTISKNNINITEIYGGKIFNSPILFSNEFIINCSLDDLNLHRFHEKAIYIDKSSLIDSKVIFKEDIYVNKNLLIETKLQSNTIMGVDMKNLQENVIALNKPNYFSERIIIHNVTFQAAINVTEVNDLKMNLLIPLHTNQFITAEYFNCINVTFKNVQLLGKVNDFFLDNIYIDTFMIYDNQNITGNIKFLGNIHAYHDFNTPLINSFNPKQIISLTANDTLTGNFMFKDRVILDNSLRILGLLNKIKPINWQGVAIRTTREAKQIISGRWKIYGNVYFEKNVDGTELLNGVDVKEVSTAMKKEYTEIEDIDERTNEKLNNICENLDTLKCNAINQIYKFNTFDYSILEFDGDIHDIRNIEWYNYDYLLVNYDNCRLKLLLYTSTGFEVIDEVLDFGLINQWNFFKLNGRMHIITSAKRTCKGSPKNVWKLENNRITHVMELGTDVNVDINAHENELVTMIHKSLDTTSENVRLNISEAFHYENKNSSYENEDLITFLNNNPIVPDNQSLIYQLQKETFNEKRLRNCVGCISLLNFKVGIFEREEYIYYDEKVSQNYIYICENDISQTKILQIIKAHRPKTFLVLSFEGFVETLLIFVENNETINIYEYQGIKGFVYRNAIKMKVDKLYKFKMRKYTNLRKKHYLAAIYKNRLTIMEAKMYGLKLDLETLTMDTDVCLFDTIKKCK